MNAVRNIVPMLLILTIFLQSVILNNVQPISIMNAYLMSIKVVLNVLWVLPETIQSVIV